MRVGALSPDFALMFSVGLSIESVAKMMGRKHHYDTGPFILY